VRERFEQAKLDAQQLSPKSEKPRHPEHNADSIQVRVKRTAKGPKATIFTESGYGGYLEVGTAKMPGRPYIYPAVTRNLGEIPEAVRVKLGATKK
jgi:HK97 gp10 family phage protein